MNKLKSARVDIRYFTESGFQASQTYRDEASKAILQGIGELARLAALNGDSDAAIQVVWDAVQRVSEWKEQQQPSAEGDGNE